MLNKNNLLISEEELFRRAIQMTETMGAESFDACVEALRKCNGVMEQAIKLLLGTSVLMQTA